MATTVPETIRTSATAGERLLFRTLKEYLPDDYIVYFEPEIKGVRPDFVIIGPDIGLLVLEVKDYTSNTLYQLNQDQWTIQSTSGNLHTVKSPLVQAREYAFKVVDVLKKDKNLIQGSGKYQFQLKFPYGYGVVFTRLSEQQIVKNQLYHVIDMESMLARESINPEDPLFSEEQLIERLIGMFKVNFRLKEPLTYEEINTIRYYLFPEVRLGAEFQKTIPHQDQLLLSLYDIKTMDLHQENLAKQIGDRHRMIRGVAGSGKTLILASRAKMLAKQHPDWKILILCYNISLSQNIKYMIQSMYSQPEDLFDYAYEKGNSVIGKIPDNLHILNFHQWLKQSLKTSEKQIDELIDSLENNKIIVPKYDAILIDEGQDFQMSWLHLVSLCLNPETQSLLLVEDRAQSIYKKKGSYAKETGLDFRGRSKILNINYRNTSQIVKFAWEFFQQHSVLKNKVVSGQTDSVELISPLSTRRKGPEVALMKVDKFAKEVDLVARQIIRLHQTKNVPFSEMIILYRVKRTYKHSVVDELRRSLTRYGIDYEWISENEESKRSYNPESNSVKLSTIDSSKGLDFQAVFMIKVDLMPFPLEKDVEREVSLMYIGMTRAKEYLYLSYSEESEFTAYLDQVKAIQSVVASQQA